MPVGKDSGVLCLSSTTPLVRNSIQHDFWNAVDDDNSPPHNFLNGYRINSQDSPHVNDGELQ